MSSAVARRRAVTLLALSIILPGTAQVVAGNRALGRIVLRVWLGLLGLGLLIGLVAFVSVSTIVGLLSAPWFLTIAQWTLFAWAAVWAFVVIDAWRLGRPTSQPAHTRRRFAIATVVLMLVPATVAYAGASVSSGRSALAAVFADGPALDSTDGRYNILLLGGDGGDDREGTRPDTIQLVSIDERSGRAVLFAFARDTEYITFDEGSVMAGLMPEGWNCGHECLLNGIYTWAWDHEDEFPEGTENPGLLATREAVEALSGLDVHYHVIVDLDGFRDVIDALGGLEINVARRTPIGGIGSQISGWIEPGAQHLDGQHALWYARSRVGSTNYERMARQRCVITAMAQQIDPVSVAARFGSLASSTAGVLETDFPQSELGRFADLALKTKSQKISSVSFVPPLMKPWNYEPEFVRDTVAQTIEASEDLEEDEATVAPVTPAPSAGASDEPTSTADTPTEADPGAGLERPGEDENAQTDDAAQVCSVG
ncbi:MAG: LCP family protein [Intrasporangiaceae bacterium]|nr:LCP family protein [Intrasporangiaceae bacterium]